MCKKKLTPIVPGSLHRDCDSLWSSPCYENANSCPTASQWKEIMKMEEWNNLNESISIEHEMSCKHLNKPSGAASPFDYCVRGQYWAKTYHSILSMSKIFNKKKKYAAKFHDSKFYLILLIKEIWNITFHTIMNTFHVFNITIVSWESEGRYIHRHCRAIAPFWFSIEHLWILISPFWL